MIAYCGLPCQSCPLYLATREQNKAEQVRMRLEIARLCNDQYGMNYALEDITDCDGCLTTTGRLFPRCKDCPIRTCAQEKQLENCAHCAQYACEKLEAFFRTDPEARPRLDALRATLS